MKPAETINDITHEMCIPGTEYPTKKDLRALADRIEAAAARQVVGKLDPANATPFRNCDRHPDFQTAYAAWCDAPDGVAKHASMARWLYLPAEGKENKQ